MDGENYHNRPISMTRRNGNVPDARFTKPSFLSSLLSPLNPFKTKVKVNLSWATITVINKNKALNHTNYDEI